MSAPPGSGTLRGAKERGEPTPAAPSKARHATTDQPWADYFAALSTYFWKLGSQCATVAAGPTSFT